MTVTDNFGFHEIDVLNDLLKYYNGDISRIDTILNILGSPGDGSPVTVSEPTDPLSYDFLNTGNLPSGNTFWYTYTYIDSANGLESIAADPIEVMIPDAPLAPDAPTLVSAGSGGTLTPGTYNYILTRYVDTPATETAAVHSASINLPTGQGNDQKITLTLPSLGDATGFNIYRRRPGNVSYNFIASTTSGSFVDTGIAADSERFAPATGNLTSSVSVELIVPDVPAGYFWNIYRTDIEDDFNNKLIGTVIDGSDTFVDTYLVTDYGTPPLETPFLNGEVVWSASGVTDLLSRRQSGMAQLFGEPIVDPGVSMDLDGTLEVDLRPSSDMIVPIVYYLDMTTRTLGILRIRSNGIITLETDSPISNPAAVFIHDISYRLVI